MKIYRETLAHSQYAYQSTFTFTGKLCTWKPNTLNTAV